MVNDYRPALNAVGWSFGALATFVVFSRIYCRAFAVQKQGWDDWLMVFAWAAAIVTTALVTVSTTYGFGIHEADITSVSDLENAIKYILIAPAISLLASASAKLSVVLFLLRLLGLAATIPHRIILYTTTALMIGGNIFAMVVLLGYCNPPRKAWDPTVEGTCMSAQVLNIGGRAVTVYNAFMDLLCAAFPVLMLWTLNMRSKMKWGLAVVMSGGVLGAVASLVKVVVMGQIEDTSDMTYSWAMIAIWYMTEMYAIIIAGSIPTLRPLWALIRNKEYHSGESYPLTRKTKGGSSTTPRKKSGSKDTPVEGIITMELRELGTTNIGDEDAKSQDNILVGAVAHA